MSGEQRRSEIIDDEHATCSAQAASDASDVTLGLVPAPELPTEEIANQLARELPELLANYVDDRLSWQVPVVTDPLTGAAEDSA